MTRVSGLSLPTAGATPRDVMARDTLGPQVSVLVPCFRAERFLSQALESIVRQEWRDWEAIVVDNASDDGTYRVAEELAGRDPRIRVYRNASNVGPVRNWRRCAELGRAPLAALLFADDWYDPRFLGRALPFIRGDARVGFVYSAARVVRSDTDESTIAYQLTRTGVFPVRTYVRGHTDEMCYDVPVSPGCGLFRREDLLRSLSNEPHDPHGLGFMRHGAGPDLKIFLDACVRYPAFAHVAEPLVNFRSHGGNLSSGPNVRAAYQAALVRWASDEGRSLVNGARVRARARLTLRRDSLSDCVVPQLGLAEWVQVPVVAFRKVLRKLSRRLRRLGRSD